MPLITAVSEAFKEVAALLREWIAGASIRRMQAAIEAGEKYIQTNEDTTIKPNEKEKLLKTYKARFFHFN